ncbi:alternative splicing regulator-domain-containing protein [Gongronella butleri]|nr:alternative splicing regulator-domain-containing protein [Gongronella butleri]
MWHETKANEKRVKEIMQEHKRRAERRKAYFDSKLGDPKQLLRVIGTNLKLYPSAEQYYYHENTKNMIPWPGDPSIKIDRFDGRALLDELPPIRSGRTLLDVDGDDAEELNFERYRDLVEAERLDLTPQARLATVDEQWTKLLDRHKANLAMIEPTRKPKSQSFGYDYGTSSTSDTSAAAGEADRSVLSHETDLLNHLHDLPEADRRALVSMGTKYGIRNCFRQLLRAKRHRDQELEELKQKATLHGESSKKDKKERKRQRRRERARQRYADNRHGRRSSPTYDPYGSATSGSSDDDSDSDASDTSDHRDNAIEIEFGAPDPLQTDTAHNAAKRRVAKPSSAPTAAAPPKKLTPMEKLKMKMRAGLEKSIQSTEDDKQRKEQERHNDHMQAIAKEQARAPPMLPEVQHECTVIILVVFTCASPQVTFSFKVAVTETPTLKITAPSPSRSPSPPLTIA